MTVDRTILDAHEQPSDQLKSTWKAYSRTEPRDLVDQPDIDDLQVPEKAAEFCSTGSISSETLKAACKSVEGDEWVDRPLNDAPIYFHPLLPGLLIIPSLVPPSTQKVLLSRMIHRDLSDPIHQTNLHLHYDIPYLAPRDGKDGSFFSFPVDSPEKFTPKDPAVHKPLSIKQVLERRLSWVTLGGQYDWTNRVYPEQQPPNFPHDISDFLHTLFPETEAQAAIVNFYSPGDTMMMHRDVSEETDKGLVSLSIGCEALFMIAPNRPAAAAVAAADTNADRSSGHGTEGKEGLEESPARKPYLLLRLRSGDAIYMTKESRYAWHGVPKVLKGTCPAFLADWPAKDGKYEGWRGWMSNKRINLNVRQMRD